MKRSLNVSNVALVNSIKEAQKDPNFIKDINKFIKATTKIYKLNSKSI